MVKTIRIVERRFPKFNENSWRKRVERSSQTKNFFAWKFRCYWQITPWWIKSKLVKKSSPIVEKRCKSKNHKLTFNWKFSKLRNILFKIFRKLKLKTLFYMHQFLFKISCLFSTIHFICYHMLVGAVWTIIILSILLFIITVMQCISLFHIFLVWGRHISHATPFVSVARITSFPTAIYGACAALAHLQRHARRLRRLIFLLKFFERHAKIAQRHGPYYPQSCRKIHLVVIMQCFPEYK